MPSSSTPAETGPKPIFSHTFPFYTANTCSCSSAELCSQQRFSTSDDSPSHVGVAEQSTPYSSVLEPGFYCSQSLLKPLQFLSTRRQRSFCLFPEHTLPGIIKPKIFKKKNNNKKCIELILRRQQNRKPKSKSIPSPCGASTILTAQHEGHWLTGLCTTALHWALWYNQERSMTNTTG